MSTLADVAAEGPIVHSLRAELKIANDRVRQLTAQIEGVKSLERWTPATEWGDPTCELWSLGDYLDRIQVLKHFGLND